ncbi:MAG: winged helix-turn-helix transcriptional regulator, partial [Pyrinomonadaceae bacterium]|nr:winged helix-turn-helix transcriptional regulator [Pyrinomonadaceae bacterium]
MRRTIRTLAALATITLGVAGYLISTDHKHLASRCFYSSVALYSAAFLLWLIKSTRSWFSRRYVRLEQNAAPKLVKRFTVKWDEQSEPHCPVCGTELAPLYADPSTALPSRSHFKCISCNHIYCLTNEETGKPLTLLEAKELLSPTKTEIEPLKSLPPAPQTAARSSVSAPDETAIKILAFLNDPRHRRIYGVEIGNELNLSYSLISRYLEQLKKQGYVELTVTGESHSLVCDITPKGRELIAENNLLEIKPKAAEADMEPPKKETGSLRIRQFTTHLQLIHDLVPKNDDVPEGLVDRFHQTLHDI